jgi:hypothetical protein
VALARCRCALLGTSRPATCNPLLLLPYEQPDGSALRRTPPGTPLLLITRRRVSSHVFAAASEQFAYIALGWLFAVRLCVCACFFQVPLTPTFVQFGSSSAKFRGRKAPLWARVRTHMESRAPQPLGSGSQGRVELRVELRTTWNGACSHQLPPPAKRVTNVCSWPNVAIPWIQMPIDKACTAAHHGEGKTDTEGKEGN